MASWGKSGNEHELSEITTSAIRMMDEDSQKGLLFNAIRACELNAIRNVLHVNRNLVQSKLYGYEGSDVFEVIKNSKTKRCYFYTGQEKDGFFYPLHIATEAGHKNLTVLLVRAGADVTATDYRGQIAEEKCTGVAIHAFYELQGLKYEAAERYVGKTDRAGKRFNQGVLYFKPEGYEMTEKQLYRGSFKNDLYHGHGTLYWPGSENIQYIGRFKGGMKHGRGIEFDELGHKIYQGIFRDDKREGRGDEYLEDTRIYKGEFSDNLRHGFGVAYFEEGAKYYGRYESGLMCGVGIYCHPNGDRFEGMFFGNKPDGPGSFYERDHYTGNHTGNHAIWQGGRKVKDTNFPFVPTSADLPDHDGKEIFSEIMQYAGMSEEITSADTPTHATTTTTSATGTGEHFYEEGEEDSGEDSEEDEYKGEKNTIIKKISVDSPPPPHTTTTVDMMKSANAIKSSLLGHEAASKLTKKNFSYFDGEGCMSTVGKGDVWKVQLGKYLKLPLKEAPTLGLRLPPDLLHQLTKINGASGNGESGENETTEEGGSGALQEDSDEEVELEEVSGYHFMDCMPLFVSYVYVTSASKVFEDRLVNRGLHAEFPDFESVYHLVIDAVDTYNEGWERAFKEQEVMKMEQAAGILPTTNSTTTTASAMESKRRVFMTEKEKKEQLILKQRAELALKKGTAELLPEMERKIELNVLNILESELTKLINDDNNNENIKINSKNKKIIHSHAGAVVIKKSYINNKDDKNKQDESVDNGKTSTGNNNGKQRRLSHTKYKKGEQTYDIDKMNIDDLFDVFMDTNQQASIQYSDDGNDQDNIDIIDENISNEFAEELLYMMRTAMSLS